MQHAYVQVMSASPGRTRAGQESALQFLRESLGVSKSTITRLERMRKLIASPAPRIVETVTGYRAYHLSESGKNGEPTLCKADVMVMSTMLHLRCWNQTGHLREKYCKECTCIAERNGVALPKADASTLVF